MSGKNNQKREGRDKTHARGSSVVVKDRERIRTAAVLTRKQNEVIVRPEGIPLPIVMSMLLLLWEKYLRQYSGSINPREKK
jgi:hypothetical protein